MTNVSKLVPGDVVDGFHNPQTGISWRPGQHHGDPPGPWTVQSCTPTGPSSYGVRFTNGKVHYVGNNCEYSCVAVPSVPASSIVVGWSSIAKAPPAAVIDHPDLSKWPHRCPSCGNRAYVGLNTVEHAEGGPCRIGTRAK